MNTDTSKRNKLLKKHHLLLSLIKYNLYSKSILLMMHNILEDSEVFHLRLLCYFIPSVMHFKITSGRVFNV